MAGRLLFHILRFYLFIYLCDWKNIYSTNKRPSWAFAVCVCQHNYQKGPIQASDFIFNVWQSCFSKKVTHNMFLVLKESSRHLYFELWSIVFQWLDVCVFWSYAFAEYSILSVCVTNIRRFWTIAVALSPCGKSDSISFSGFCFHFVASSYQSDCLKFWFSEHVI